MIKLNFSVRKQYYTWCGLITIFILTLIAPAGNGAIRLMTVLSAIGIWLGIPWLWRSRKIVLTIWTIVTMLFTIFLLSPGSIVAADVLRSDYIDSLKTYHNTKYVWGGENHLNNWHLVARSWFILSIAIAFSDAIFCPSAKPTPKPPH
jgi:hypothetical protein